MIGKADVSIATQKMIKERYSILSKSQKETIIEAVTKLLNFSMSTGTSISSIRNEVVRTIHRIFEFQFVSLAMRDRADNKYHYVACIGLTGSAEASYKQIVYSPGDLLDDGSFPSTKTSKFTRFYMAEDKPFKDGEEASYSRPTMLSQIRPSMEDMVEGDYIDVFMYGHVNDIIGWIELAGTRNNKLPARESIKWIEMIGSLLAQIELQQEAGRR